MKKYLITILGLLISSSILSQEKELFIPLELQEAYEKGTRSYTGEPGEKYFQNESRYKIEADFNPATGFLEGNEEITYYNNSPDSLEYIAVRLYMNLMKEGFGRDFTIPPVDLHDGVEYTNFEIDGKELDSEGGPFIDRDMGTVQLIKLSEPIAPNGQASLSIGWEVQLPRQVAIRMGQYGKENWFVAYWYPQISVYDDITDWATQPFTGSAEFYNDFSDFDVTIKVPKDFMVWATGILQKPDKHFKPGVLERFNQAHESDTVVNIITTKEIEQQDYLTREKEWNYKAEGVPDFAFAVSSSYLWDGTSIMIDTASQERIFVSAAYKKDSRDFHKVAGLSREIIKVFSKDIMQANYPYPKMTAFNGSGGMEFPMMINDGDSRNHIGTVHLTAHEIGHAYFPFYVMTNETSYAFMDEGLISFLPRIAEERLLNGYEPFTELVKSYEAAAGSMSEIPLMIKSYMISDYAAYRTHAYTRPGTAFYLLYKMLGEEDFNKALKEYIERWKWKHPTPYDFFFTFEDVLERDLSWFWEPWFFEFGYADLAIGEVNSEDGEHKIKIENKGKMPVPVVLKIQYTDGSDETIREEADVWESGESSYTLQVSNQKNIQRINLGASDVPDVKTDNNAYKADN
ncbi:MAG: M1 family metallopeptidase [Bacteroidales bacterium]